MASLRVFTLEFAMGICGLVISQAGFFFQPHFTSSMSAHLPGGVLVREGWRSGTRPHFRVCQKYSQERPAVWCDEGNGETGSEYTVRLQTLRNNSVPEDFIHAMYGLTRLCWLRMGILMAHAACVESLGSPGDKEYILVMGVSGAGKTSTTLHCLQLGARVFSGNTTLIRIDERGGMYAVAGTRTMTIRSKDQWRWTWLDKEGEHVFGDRVAFELAGDSYCPDPTVRIRKIVIVSLADCNPRAASVDSLSALHRLFPLFMNQMRSDTLLGGAARLINGAVAAHTKLELARLLEHGLQHISVHEFFGSTCDLGIVGLPQLPRLPGPLRLLFGICGIGNGHRNRQILLVQFLLKQGAQIVMFTYSDCIGYFKKLASQAEEAKLPGRLVVLPVFNPFMMGCISGLDFRVSASLPSNISPEGFSLNCHAMSEANRLIGAPDLVISDYECVSAQYGYSKGSKIVTIDQQSKYFLPGFQERLGGTSFRDEIERLRMFFPVASSRIAMTFFRPPEGAGSSTNDANLNREQVKVIAPVMKAEITALFEARATSISSSTSSSMSRDHRLPAQLLVYMTAQEMRQTAAEWLAAISSVSAQRATFSVFIPPSELLPSDLPILPHISVYRVPHPDFHTVLGKADGVITTAGHTLLSECMYIGTPVLCVPLPLYEQQANAHAISDNCFGMHVPHLTSAAIEAFISQLPIFLTNIRTDCKVLTRSSKLTDLWALLEPLLPRGRVSHLAVARSGSTTLTERMVQLAALCDSTVNMAAMTAKLQSECFGENKCIFRNPSVLIHHDHRATVRDLESLGSFHLFACIRLPTDRIISGHCRRLQGHATSRAVNQIYQKYFSDINSFVESFARGAPEAMAAVGMTSGQLTGQRWMVPTATYLNGRDARTRITWLRTNSLDQDWASVLQTMPGGHLIHPLQNLRSRSSGDIKQDQRALLTESSRLWISSHFAEDYTLFQVLFHFSQQNM